MTTVDPTIRPDPFHSNLSADPRKHDAKAAREASPLWPKAQALEAAFLAEMLGHAGVGSASETFGGGIGEDQFASFLRQEQATALVARGGIGLAESLFRALTRGADERAAHD